MEPNSTPRKLEPGADLSDVIAVVNQLIDRLEQGHNHEARLRLRAAIQDSTIEKLLKSLEIIIDQPTEIGQRQQPEWVQLRRARQELYKTDDLMRTYDELLY